jgi:mono/diheme cytochrome c family protein
MRHLLANIAVYVLAGGLVVGSVLFAWARSQQLVFATERAVEPPAYIAADSPEVFDWEDFGERVYVANCQNCHGSAGTGRDVYPPVVGQGAMLAAEGGRAYLTRLVIYGLWTGTHSAPMPPMPHLSDAQIAAVNNYITTRFDAGVDTQHLYIPRDVSAERGLRLSERDVGRQRPMLRTPGASE